MFNALSSLRIARNCGSKFLNKTLRQCQSQTLKYNTISLSSNCPSRSFSIFSDPNKPPAQTVSLDKDTKIQMPTSTPTHTVYITSPEEWKHVVGTATVPIVLDCYADWCQPCRKLTPLLDERVKQGNGKWMLVKLNIDENPDLATALKIRSIPTVILIHGGNVIDMFVGMPTDDVMKNFFDFVDKLTGAKEQEAQIEERYQYSLKLIDEEKNADAQVILNELLKNEEWLNRYGAKVNAALAYSYIRVGDKNRCLNHVKNLKLKYSTDVEDESVKKYVELIDQEFEKIAKRSQEDTKLIDLEHQLEQDPGNLRLRYEIAEYVFENELYEKAVEACIQLMKIDRNWEERKAHKLLLKIFEKLGATHPLVISSRKQLQRILF